MLKQNKAESIELCVYRTRSGQLQVCIGIVQGHGVRLLGPKMISGNSTLVARRQLSGTDMNQIQQYIDMGRGLK